MVELLAVLALLGVLASLAFPLSEATARRKKETELRYALREIRSAIDAYKKAFDAGLIAGSASATGYPPNLNVLVRGAINQKDPNRSRLYFLRRIPKDPMTIGDPKWQGEWRLRSYDSPPDDPKPGRDVFDVSSASERIGSNRIAYREW